MAHRFRLCRRYRTPAGLKTVDIKTAAFGDALIRYAPNADAAIELATAMGIVGDVVAIEVDEYDRPVVRDWSVAS